MIDKLKPCKGGGFTDPDGFFWKRKSDYLMMDVLPSCGCGDPPSIGKYVK